MSQDNIEQMRGGVEMWNAGDWGRFRELFDPDVVMRAPEGWPEPGPFVGRDAVMQEFARLQDAFDHESLEIEGEMRASGDRVIARLIWHVAGRGPEAEMEVTAVWTVRRGLIIGQEYFWDHADALEAAGLSE
jgi:ketosteroid isomerase-like protein